MQDEKESRETMDTGYSKWRKLDNAALAFPLVTGKDDTRVFRFYCQLKEKVDGEILQSALDQAMEKYPLFQAVLRKGLFWFYLEHRSLRAVVKQETEPPCSRLYIPDKKSLLFQVSYDKNRINFEVFHALTDGTGAMHFLQELVSNYLKKAHPKQDLPSGQRLLYYLFPDKRTLLSWFIFRIFLIQHTRPPLQDHVSIIKCV